MAEHDDSVWDGLVHIAEDIVDEVVDFPTTVVDTVVSAGQALGHLAAAADFAIHDQDERASQELGNAIAEGYNAVPFHEAAWDAMMTLGRAIDGEGNNDLMWDQGGEEAFREAWGGTPPPPEPEHHSYDPSTDGPEA